LLSLHQASGKTMNIWIVTATSAAMALIGRNGPGSGEAND